MRSPLRRLLVTALLCLPTVVLADYPNGPVRLNVGFPPGTGPDIVARTLSQQLGERLKQSVVVENRAGAGGQIAAQAVARSPADGQTLLLGEVGSISISPATYDNLNYDPAKDFAPISEVVRADFALVVPADSPYKTLADFVKAGKDAKDRVNFGTFGAGTPGHFGAELFARETGMKIEPVHYRSTGDAVTALVSGNVQAAFVTTALAAPQVQGGKMRALAITGAKPSDALPGVPTFAQEGHDKVDFGAWFALFAPAGTPDAVLDRLQKESAAALQAPEAARTLKDAGFIVVASSREDLKKLLDSEAKRWSEVVKATGFKAN
ncbi:Bug family tripartite tricarboxylate transporter substrate binding protein [Bordetella sp. 02P26C-1]|uniref:Bug family tripartite tricarboxylate transporter substrate binding protein n=1 Tax=Bordetella sp. 02P26C-1 TaxID=2683195 RepID=UPI0013559637|nr:tripartite tricarboxylate transporter substrate binding protein [Bordetella sp. 02P26C-1]MVW78067.1 tripartite tricarboxylate transporter substrate binding protein [Bordetella sp. 02P26C-1]